MYGVTDDPSRLSPTRLTDPKAVLAVTHPVRMRLLGELSRRGTARAVDLAAAVDEPANSVSFHLRQLAKHGLIEENPERAENGRERWWRLTSDRGFEIDLDAMLRHEGGQAAALRVRGGAEAHVLALHRAVHRTPDPADVPSGERRSISDDFAVRLSDTELQQMRREVAELLDRWTDISRALTDTEDGQERHAYYGVVLGALVQDISAVDDAPQREPHP